MMGRPQLHITSSEENRVTGQSHGLSNGPLEVSERGQIALPIWLLIFAFLLLLPAAGLLADGSPKVHRKARLYTGATRVNGEFTASSSASPLKFLGDSTVLIPPVGGTFLALQRQGDCSITEDYVSGGMSAMMQSKVSFSSVANYQDYLHTIAGLTTTGGSYPNGCKDQQLGIPSRYGANLGLTKDGASSIGAYIDFNNNLHVDTLNLSTGAFTETEPLTGTAFYLLSADVEGDGYPDLLVETFTSGSTTTPITVYHNNGDGTFTAGATLQFSAFLGGLLADDLNGDGKIDLAATTEDGKLLFLAGKGDGTFGTPISTALGAFSASIATGDFNGDGKKDLVLSSGAILLGNGAGQFAAAASSIPVGGTPVVGDWNNDGKEDIAMATVGEPGSLTIFLGSGTGAFSQGKTYQTANNLQFVSAADLDGDGNLDLIVGEGNGGFYGPDYNSGGIFQVLMGHGDGTFAGAPSYQDDISEGFRASGEFVPGDFHGKGYVDVLTTFPGGIQLLSNNGAGAFTVSLPITVTESVSGLRAADMDSDGKTDVIFVESNNNEDFDLAIAIGNGDGTFQAKTTTALAAQATLLAVSDFTGDGKPDVILAEGTEIFLLVNEGTGQVGTPKLIATEANPVVSAAVADLNGDKKLDLVVAESTPIQGTAAGAAVVFLGNGDGTFKTGVSYAAGFAPLTIAIGDINKDGIADLVVGSTANDFASGSLSTLLGNGDGTFKTAISTALNYAGIASVSLADFNGDGNTDVAVATCCGATYSMVAFGNGTGSFPTINNLALASSSTAVVALDVNNDTKPDLLLQTESVPASLVILTNQYGSATTAPTSTTTQLSASATNVKAGTKITFTVTVKPMSGASTPSGTVTIYDGTSKLGTGTLSSGVATYSTSALAAGTHSITASYGGDTSNAASTSAAVSITVTTALAPTSSVLTASAASIALGTSVTFTDITSSSAGIPTGTVTFLDGASTLGTGTLNSSGKATYTTSTLSAGTHSITASYAGSSSDADSKSAAVTVKVTSATIVPTTSVLTASATSIAVGSSVTFTDITTSGAGTPAGTVTFLDGSTTLGTGTLSSSGKATYTTSTLSAGTHSITAAYAGDSTYGASKSSVLTEAVTAPSFMLGVNPSSLTMSQIESSTATITVTPSGGFNTAISFACSGLPVNATCSFSPSTVTPAGNAAATTTLTLATGVKTTAALNDPQQTLSTRVASGIALATLLLPWTILRGRRKAALKRISGLSALLIVVGILALVNGCGGGLSNATPAGSSSVIITATGGSLTQAATIQLTVK